MGALFFQRERNDTERIKQPAAEGEEKQGEHFPEHAGQEHQSQPAQHDVKRHMNPPDPVRSEHADQRKSGDNDSPLDAAQDRSGVSCPEQEPKRSKRPADQQVDGNIVKPPPKPLHRRSPFERVVQAAHQEHQDHAQAVNDGAHDLRPCIGTDQHQHRPGNGCQGAHAVGGRVPHLFEHRPFRRLFPGLFRPFVPGSSPFFLFFCQDPCLFFCRFSPDFVFFSFGLLPYFPDLVRRRVPVLSGTAFLVSGRLFPVLVHLQIRSVSRCFLPVPLFRPCCSDPAVSSSGNEGHCIKPHFSGLYRQHPLSYLSTVSQPHFIDLLPHINVLNFVLKLVLIVLIVLKVFPGASTLQSASCRCPL